MKEIRNDQELPGSRAGVPLKLNKLLLAILLGGALLRLLFLILGAKLYYGAALAYTNGDSGSYMLSFENLFKHGTYTFDFSEPDAAFGRLPGFPFFYGLHYLLFGPKYAIIATACTQALLDCGSILLIFLVVHRLAPASRVAPYVAAVLYAGYPFIIVWETIMGTELLATFLTMLWLYLLLRAGHRNGAYILIGLELAWLFYTREFLGMLLPITCLYLLLWQGVGGWVAMRRCVLVCLGFGLLYGWWPVRNYVFQHRIMLVKPERAGFSNYKEDMTSFLDWVHSWSNESTYWLQQVLTNAHPDFPAYVFASSTEQAQAQALVQQANECGSSFIVYRFGKPSPAYEHPGRYQSDANAVNCNAQVSVGFAQLRASFKQHHPLQYYAKVPLENLYKVFFKSGTQSADGTTRKQLLTGLLFGYRSLLLLLGVIGLLVFRQLGAIKLIALFWGCIMLFICLYFRQVEMRYILQADVLLLIPATLLLSRGLASFRQARILRSSPSQVLGHA